VARRTGEISLLKIHSEARMKMPKWFSFLYRKYWRLRRVISIDLSPYVNWGDGEFGVWWRKYFD
jgi:hypothetical protein